MTKKRAPYIIFLIFFIFPGCIPYKYPRLEKELYAKRMTKTQITEIKEVIKKEGYFLVGKEDSSWEGAFVTQYSKGVPVEKVRNQVQILLSFKIDDSASCKNFGVNVLSFDENNAKEITNEIQRMEELLYDTLVQMTERHNIKRGEKEIYQSTH